MTLDTKVTTRFRSNGELAVARALDELNLPYHYEPDIFLREGPKRYIWHPDFYLPSHHAIIEYFGVQYDQTYKSMIQRKKRIYHANHYHLIPVYPATLQRNYKAYILKSIQTHAKRQLGDIEKRLREYHNR